MPAAFPDTSLESNAPADAFLAAPPLEFAGEENSADGEADGIVDRILAAITHQQATGRLPSATYRVQLNASCCFKEVQGAVSYFHTLGISDLYASPFLQAQPRSPHGYDIVNHAAINPEIGTLDELRRSAPRCASMEWDSSPMWCPTT